MSDFKSKYSPNKEKEQEEKFKTKYNRKEPKTEISIEERKKKWTEKQ